MKMKPCLVISLITIAAIWSVPIKHVDATPSGLNLPLNMVKIEVFNGTDTYFATILSNVPEEYDVANGTYSGWCVDRTAEMARSPAVHEVRLYASTDPPGELAFQNWDMVNYILNHKQGSAMDIQQAIWHFIDIVGNYSTTSDTAVAIINDALANGGGFVPGIGQLIAIICLPMMLLPRTTSIQTSIIELVDPVPVDPVIPEFPSLLILPLFVTGTLLTVFVYKRKSLKGNIQLQNTF